MRKIENQLIFSTHDTKTGITLSESDVRQAFTQIPERMPLNQDHDLTKPTVGFLTNKKLARTPDGKLAVFADIHLEADMELDGKGLSPGFKMIDPKFLKEVETSVVIEYNKLSLSEDEIRRFEQLSTENLSVTRGPILLFSAETVLLGLTLIFICEKTLGGFFDEAGRDLYKALRKELRELVETKESENNKHPTLTAEFKTAIEGSKLKIICKITDDYLCDDYQPRDLNKGIEYATRLAGSSGIREICLEPDDSPQSWKVVWFEDSDGKITPLAT